MATYENIGTHDVLGHAPGEIFEADLDPVTEARLASGNHLKRVGASSTTATALSGAPTTSAFVAVGAQRNEQSTDTATKNDDEPEDDAETPDADDDVAA